MGSSVSEGEGAAGSRLPGHRRCGCESSWIAAGGAKGLRADHRGETERMTRLWAEKARRLAMKVLLVTGIEGAANCAAALKGMLGMDFDVAGGRRAAISALKHTEYAAVVVDEALVDADPAGADQLWELTGLAIPVQVNLALSGAQRVAREIRTAMSRRERERQLAHRAAAAAIESELKSTVAGLVLHSQLALAERELPGPWRRSCE